MTKEEVLRAAPLVEAFNGIEYLRDEIARGIAERAPDDKALELVYTYEISSGGSSGKGSVLVPIHLGPAIVDFAEKLMRDELDALGVTP